MYVVKIGEFWKRLRNCRKGIRSGPNNVSTKAMEEA
jgi:hypothetical protein